MSHLAGEVDPIAAIRGNMLPRASSKEAAEPSRWAPGWGELALAVALLVLPVGRASAQNLVPNPSFESNSGIPTGYSQLNLAIQWQPPTNGSPDYFHALATGPSGMSVPTNDFGNQLPHPNSGQAYAGFHARPVNLYREYVETPLSAPLAAGLTYQVSFYVSLADQSRWAIDKIGAYLSINQVGPVATGYTLPFSPQISHPVGNYITDKTNWTLVTGQYLATGGERYLVIGNFSDNPSTTPLMGQGGSYDFSYYYLDDVSVLPPCAQLPSGMVGWWPLDETAGTAVQEQPGVGATTDTGAAAPGPINGGGPPPVTGMVQGALYFASPAVHVNVTDSSDLDAAFATSDFTIDAWIRDVSGEPHAVRPIVDKLDVISFNSVSETGVGTGYAFYVYNDLMKLALGDGTSLVVLTSNSIPLLHPAWHHVAVAVTRTTTAATATFYLDGATVGTATQPLSGSIDNALPLRIGANPFPSPFDAQMETALDEIEIFKRVLSQADISRIFSAGGAGKCKAVVAKADLGDAPDSTNHFGTTMLTYAVANFPTTYAPSAPGPAGPFHLSPQGFAWLGQQVTLEEEADIGWDQDPSNNLLPGITTPTADHDGSDDGVTSVPLPDCALTQFPFSTFNALSFSVQAYVNVWFDWTRDGDWDDLPKCAVAPNVDALAAEWAIQNHVVTLTPGFNPGLPTPPFRSINPPPGNPTWMRISLTDVPITAANHGGPFPNAADLGKGGSGPISGYQSGETEDYLWRITSGGARICVLKFKDKNGNGTRNVGEPRLPNWTIEIKDVGANVVAALATGSNGTACATVPAPAFYTVAEVPQAGWKQTFPALGTHTVTVSAGQTVNLSFGNKKRFKTPH